MSDGDLNLATLWLPVAPETSKVGPAMEQAGRDAKSRFGNSVKGIGDTIHDDLAKAGAKAKDAFAGVGKSITDVFKRAGSDSGKALSEGFASSARDLEKIPAPLRGIAETASHATTGVQNLSGAFSSLKSGDVANALDHAQKSIDGINNLTKNVGVDISGWSPSIAQSQGPLSATDEKLSGLVSGAKDFAGIFEKLPGKIGALASSISGVAGEIGLVVEGLKVAGPYIDAIDQKIHDSSGLGRFAEDHSPSTWGGDLADSLGADRVRAWMGRTFGYDPDHVFGQDNPNGDDKNRPLSGFEKFAIELDRRRKAMANLPNIPLPTTRPSGTPPHNFYKDWYGPDAQAPEPEPAAPRSSGGGGRTSSYTKPSIGSVTNRQGLYAAGSRVAALYSFAQSLVGTPYDQQLRNDCSGMVSQLASVALGLPPPDAGNRFTTVNEGDWLMSHGFREGMGGPGDLRIGWYDHGGGNAGHTAATLPGGEHAESGGSHGAFLVGPGAAGADNPEFEHHAYLPMGGAGGSSGPMGSKSDPLYVSSADGESGNGGSGPWESQGQQLGQGLVNGIAEMFGVDGSVFKGFGSGKGLLDFGAIKLGGGLLSWGAQMMQSRGAGGGGLGAGGGGLGAGAGVAGGDGASIPGLGMLSGLGNLIPGHGAAIAANSIPATGAAAVGGGNTTVNVHGDVNSGFNVTQHGVQGNGYQDWKEAYNANSTRTAPLTVPNAGGLPAG